MEFKVTSLYHNLKTIFDQADKGTVFITRHGIRYQLSRSDASVSLKQIAAKVNQLDAEMKQLKRMRGNSDGIDQTQGYL